MRDRSREGALRLMIAVAILRRGSVPGYLCPEFERRRRLRTAGLDRIGASAEAAAMRPVPEGATREERQPAAGIERIGDDARMMIETGAFDRPAQAAGPDMDQAVLSIGAPSGRASPGGVATPVLLPGAVIRCAAAVPRPMT